jgi:L-ascorbate metabolism protein UlaG (beta-lactamase superfamily)
MALHVTYLGQSGFVLDDGTCRLAIDPFLTDNPRASYDPNEIECTYIATTHGHADHVGDTVSIARRTGAAVIAAYGIAVWLGEHGDEETEPGNTGGRLEMPFGSVAFTQALHSSSYRGRNMGMPCGLVVSMGGGVLYHAGDTGHFADMAMIGDIYKPTVAAIPIVVRVTMGPELAVRAAELVGAETAIPIHYKTFPFLAQSAESFRPAGITVREMDPGETRRAA